MPSIRESIEYILTTDATLTGLVPAARIYSDRLPEDCTEVPALHFDFVAGQDNRVLMDGTLTDYIKRRYSFHIYVAEDQPDVADQIWRRLMPLLTRKLATVQGVEIKGIIPVGDFIEGGSHNQSWRHFIQDFYVHYSESWSS